METPALDTDIANSQILEQLAALHAKMDRVDANLEQISRRQRALEDLVDEFGPLGREIYQALLEELACVEEDFELEDLTNLARKLLRNTRRISDMLDTAVSLHDFLVDSTPLGKDIFNSVVERLEHLERLGAFQYGAEFLKMVEHLMEEFTPRDLEELGQAMPVILNTTRNQTQPDVLNLVNDVLGVLREQPPEPLGFWEILKALKDPQVRQALGLAMAMFRRFPVALGRNRHRQLGGRHP